MTIQYHRPNSMEEALQLLSQKNPPAVALSGGTYLSRHIASEVALVDLQNLGLNQIVRDGNLLRVGATTTLEELLAYEESPQALKEALQRDATLNMRNAATVAGSICVGTGRSAVLAVLMAMDARLVWQPGEKQMNLGEYLTLKENSAMPGLITEILIPLQGQAQMAAIGRSPLDPPFLIVALTTWPSGRARLVLGGKVKTPILAMDGIGAGDCLAAGRYASAHLANAWASEDYLQDVTGVLIQRLLDANPIQEATS